MGAGRGCAGLPAATWPVLRLAQPASHTRLMCQESQQGECGLSLHGKLPSSAQRSRRTFAATADGALLSLNEIGEVIVPGQVFVLLLFVPADRTCTIRKQETRP